MSNRISHLGIIKSVEDGCIKVQIIQTSTCSACKVANHCNAAESKVKIVNVICNTKGYREGQEVTVWTSKDVTHRALLLSFGMPFLILVCVLMIVLKITKNEGLSAIIALCSMAPYYMALWMMRDKIQRQISFNLE